MSLAPANCCSSGLNLIAFVILSHSLILQLAQGGHYLLDYTYTCVQRVFNGGVLYVLP
jgi:hypothetical protein